MAHVSTTARTFSLELIQLDAHGPRLVSRSAPLPGVPARAGAADADWAWPEYHLEVPADCPPGVKLVVAVEVEGRPEVRAPDLVGFDGSCLISVLPRQSRARLLYKLPTQTYSAYNASGGASLYVNQSWSPAGCTVSLRRPGIGTGGLGAEPIDPYSPASPRQTFWHWDWPFLCWLQRNGIDVDVATDMHLDQEPGLVQDYAAVVTAGHDEYWTARQRDTLQSFCDAGGGYGVFGANTCWWRCSIDDGLLTVDKDRLAPDSGAGLWHLTDPENRLLGMSFRHGAGWWGATRPDTPYRPTGTADPLLSGVDLSELARLTSLAGYECDGYSYAEDPARPDGADGCPPEFRPLAFAALTRQSELGWDSMAGEAPVTGIGVLRHAGGLVFNAGTVDWPLHLGNPAVDRLTRNVLSELAQCRP